MNASYQVIYWRDIPGQVTVRHGRQRQSQPLSPRFQEAIDAAAMRARATSTDAYLEDWRSSEWQPLEGEGELQNLSKNLVEELETAYPPERLSGLIKNQGFET
jgi:hypothetical protein